MFCRKCGTQFGDEDRFCPSCGTEVTKTENIPGNGQTAAALEQSAAPKPKKKAVPFILLISAAVVLIIIAVVFLGGSKCIFENYDWDTTLDEAMKKVEAKGLENSSKNDTAILYFEDNFWDVPGGKAAVVLNFEDADDTLDRVSVLVSFDSKLECSNGYDFYCEKLTKLHGEPTITSVKDKLLWKTESGIAEVVKADTLCAIGYFQDENVYEDY